MCLPCCLPCFAANCSLLFAGNGIGFSRTFTAGISSTSQTGMGGKPPGRFPRTLPYSTPTATRGLPPKRPGEERAESFLTDSTLPLKMMSKQREISKVARIADFVIDNLVQPIIRSIFF